MTDAPLTTCPSCGQEQLERLVSRSSFALKGSGWYADGYGDKKSTAESKDKTSSDKSSTSAKTEKSANEAKAEKPASESATPKTSKSSSDAS